MRQTLSHCTAMLPPDLAEGKAKLDTYCGMHTKPCQSGRPQIRMKSAKDTSRWDGHTDFEEHEEAIMAVKRSGMGNHAHDLAFGSSSKNRVSMPWNASSSRPTKPVTECELRSTQ